MAKVRIFRLPTFGHAHFALLQQAPPASDIRCGGGTPGFYPGESWSLQGPSNHLQSLGFFGLVILVGWVDWVHLMGPFKMTPFRINRSK